MMEKLSNEIVSEDIKIIVDDLKDHYNVFENKRILVVGGRGFLGTYFVKTLLEINNLIENPCKIIVVDNLITSKDKDLYNDVDFLEKDISEKFDIAGELDYIIHAASIASPPMYRKFPIKTVDVNYQGTRNLLELAKEKNISGMLYLSSSEIYGEPQIIPTPESCVGQVSANGIQMTEAKTLAIDGSDFENLMTVLILQQALDICRVVAGNYIGKVSRSYHNRYVNKEIKWIKVL